jgi:hypothetical protein
MYGQPRRTLEHWHPDLGAYEDWLAARAAEGWVREHSGALTAVIVNGRQPVALISDSHETDSRPDLGPYAER